ncbi:hypothetical protein [Salinimonas iocasae]|uniref:Uncharacterized protein n=1 Tax=Salinimonas iocasae TaxID=2572577 RepID=A0A5B7YFK3_9ALTE|nr:hypothetical protein [Salinimonas iocasae]QCZ93139.1 hypothetical protein FBQ74_06400 [Salinimonas iocasae]
MLKTTDYFDHIVLILYVVILGLAMVQHISNIGCAIRLRKKVDTYWVHTLWAILISILQTQMAEHVWGFRGHDNWSNLNVLLLIANPILIYLLVALSFPEMESVDGRVDLKKHFINNQKPFFLSWELLL